MAIRPVDLSVTNITATSVRLNWVAGALNPLQALINSLFGSAEQGALYVPQPIVNGAQALFQDAAGTVPVTTDGDPVGRMLDQSGNGNHATQSVSGSRPVYRTDGTLHWLEFDGVDDVLDSPLILNPESCVGGVAFESLGSGDGYVFGSNADGGYASQYLAIGQPSESPALLLKGSNNGTGFTLGNPTVASWSLDFISESGTVIPTNGVSYNSVFGSAVAPAAPFRIGQRPNSTVSFSLKFHGFVVAFDRNSAEDARAVYDYLKGKI